MAGLVSSELPARLQIKQGFNDGGCSEKDMDRNINQRNSDF